MAQMRTLRIVIASPSDVEAECKMLPAVVEELNRGVAADRGVRLELTRWKTDAYPGFHPEGPQGLIDPLLRIEEADLLIGIFWKWFGTPVNDAESGTEHEFKRAYESWQRKRSPQIMVYFKQKAYWPKSRVETDQWGRVLAFHENFPKEGLCWPYKNNTQFEKLVRNHLTHYIRRFVYGVLFDEFVLIRAGEFLMGSREAGHEQPIHRVRITRPFYMGIYPLTQAQWESVMGKNPSRFQSYPARPVENVSWYDVKEFIERLNARDHTAMYRLPTEAEWEYACRGGVATTYAFGDSPDQLSDYAWYDTNAGGQTQPVGQRKPNAWGLYDMHGNVYEWLEDWWRDGYEVHSTEPISDPKGPHSGLERVNRGGCWGHDAWACRCAHRGHLTPDSRRDNLGFRLVKVTP
jgi:hypothetical protein